MMTVDLAEETEEGTEFVPSNHHLSNESRGLGSGRTLITLYCCYLLLILHIMFGDIILCYRAIGQLNFLFGDKF